MDEPRPSPEEYKMALTVEAATRSNCLKIHVGAILLFDGRIRAVGYNGTLAGYEDCFDGGCDRCRDENITGGEQLDRCICVHAEENALSSAAKHGIPLKGTECYVTHEPCIGCTKLLIQAGVEKVVYLTEYVYDVDRGLDRNESRKKMRDHALKRLRKGLSGGTEFQQFVPKGDRASAAAEAWNERLKKMKRQAKAHCAAKGMLIKKAKPTEKRRAG